ncbi:MAG: M50 family metallopeptidase [Clostridia bacterium]|nr:site-2 protease family protein [Clostridia bacterium]MDD4276131.1 M50 family metallopeptidase [Clostridia bacterium]
MNFSLLNFDFLNTLSTVFYVLLAIGVLLFMVTIHELGHYTAGKILKFKINEFSIGFGKALWSKTNKSGEKVSLRLVPLGGYCAFEGEDENSDNPKAFNNQKPWKRLIVLFSGVLFNFLSAILFSAILLTFVGYSNIVQVASIETADWNLNTQIEVGDVIYGANGNEFSYFEDEYLSSVIADTEIGGSIDLLIERDGVKQTVTVVKYDTTEFIDSVAVGRIGITMQNYKFNVFESFIRAFPLTVSFAYKVLYFLVMLIIGSLSLSQVGGPLTTIGAIATYTKMSFANLLVLMPLISANLAVFNLLPFPALDGARMVFVGLEWIRKKPINRKIEGYIHFGGLVVLFAFIIIVDLIHIFS